MNTNVNLGVYIIGEYGRDEPRIKPYYDLSAWMNFALESVCDWAKQQNHNLQME